MAPVPCVLLACLLFGFLDAVHRMPRVVILHWGEEYLQASKYTVCINGIVIGGFHRQSLWPKAIGRPLCEERA